MATPVLLTRTARSALLRTIASDVELLQYLGVVDYSLLVGLYVTDIDQSKLLPPPPLAMHSDNDTAHTPLRTSAEAAALKGIVDQRRLEQRDLAMAPGIDATEEAFTAVTHQNDPANSTGSSAAKLRPTVRWLRGQAVLRLLGEERVVQLRISCAIVDVLSDGGNPTKYLEALKNSALYNQKVCQPFASPKIAEHLVMSASLRRLLSSHRKNTLCAFETSRPRTSSLTCDYSAE